MVKRKKKQRAKPITPAEARGRGESGEHRSWQERRRDVLSSDVGRGLRSGFDYGYGYTEWWQDQLGWHAKVTSEEVDEVALTIFGGYYYCVGDARQGKTPPTTGPR